MNDPVFKIVKRAFIVFVVFNLLMFALEYNAKPPKKKTSPNYNSIVRLVYDGKTFCTGTVIDKHTILTAAHCIMKETFLGMYQVDKEPIEIRTNENYPMDVYAVVFFASTQTDHALLSGNFSMFDVSPYMADIDKLVSLQVKNNNFIACGYPLYGDLYCTTLLYVDLREFMWSVKGLILPGMSGGPTMLRDGTVVGTNTAVDGNKSIVSPIFNIDKNFKK